MEVEAYARLRARLADPETDRDALLAEHGFDEDSWDRVDERWQAALSEALDRSQDDEVPPLVLRYANAFAQAQADAPGELLSLERFARATRAVRGARDPRLALGKLGVTLGTFLKASQHWTPRMGKDPALRRAFDDAFRGRRS